MNSAFNVLLDALFANNDQGQYVNAMQYIMLMANYTNTP